MRNISRLIILALLIACLSACQPQSAYTPPPDWKYADLRALDPADNISPSQDLIALYIRRLGDDVEIRLDLLDISTIQDCDLDLYFLSYSRGDIAHIAIPASGEITAVGQDSKPIPDLQPRVARDTFLDTIVVSLNRSSLLNSGLPFEVSATCNGRELPFNGDQIGPVRSDASPPQPAEILFSFWNTFPAATPAQALRMWDGAHSGPGRSRYGLRHLLNAVKGYHVPVFLLDLKTPAVLSILDFMGVLPEIRRLADSHLAILPAVARYDIPAEAISFIPNTYDFDLPPTPFLYSSGLPAQLGGNYQVLFLPSRTFGRTTPTQPYRWQEYIIVHTQEDEETTSSYQPTADGPSLALRRDLIQYATNPRTSPFILGGQLANTSWGDPACVSPTLRYLSAHPWVRFLTADNLLTLRPSGDATYGPEIAQSSSVLTTEILTALLNAPSNPVTDQAWQTYFSLLTPASPELTQLRAGYFGIIGHLITAARWAARPGSITDCTVDIDWDEQAECILASPDFFATFEPSGGYIVAAFTRSEDGIHQIIAPYAQFLVGLGDPSTWDPSRGSQGDPALVPGGFVDSMESWTPQVQLGQITFTDADNNLYKTFYLTETGLRVEYELASPMTVQISLGIDPWRRYSPGWGDAYREAASSSGWEWGLDPGPQVVITSSGTVTARAFTASRSYLSSAEDPNFDYPPGHYLPFPLALVEINGQGNFYIRLDVR
jgi:hypothetical protein